MIISRTPFRVSFIGGGSDLKEYYNFNNYGAVISTSIDRYMYIIIHPYFHEKIRLKYSKTEDVESIDDINHPIIKECIKRVGIDRGIEIASFADIPSGTGLGSSSSFTVGLLHALYAYKGIVKPKLLLAQEACEIEINTLNEPIGKQDQYAAAIGGLNHIKFHHNEEVEISPVNINKSFLNKFESTMRLYYTGTNRSASFVLKEQKQNMSKQNKVNIMKEMVSLTEEFKIALINQDLELVGKLLNYNWQLKKQMSNKISNSSIELMYEEAIKKGALGGKILGAGGGGFLLVMAFDHTPIKNSLKCRSINLKTEGLGTSVINSLKGFI